MKNILNSQANKQLKMKVLLSLLFVFYCIVVTVKSKTFLRNCQTDSKDHQAVALCLPLLRTSAGDSVLEQLRRRREGIDLWPYLSQPAAGPRS